MSSKLQVVLSNKSVSCALNPCPVLILSIDYISASCENLPSSPAYSVGVGVDVSGQVEVNDISHMGDVQPSGSHISCNQYWKLLLLESRYDLIPLVLEHISL